MPTGVQFAPPPDHLIPDIHASMARALALLPERKQTALVAVATESGVNAAVVARIGDSWNVQAWIGKTWRGPVTGSVEVMASW